MKKTNISKTVGFVSAGILLVAGIIAYKQNKVQEHSTKSEESRIKSNENPLLKYTLNPRRDTLLKLQSGTEIKIEKGTFVDANGNKINSEVNLTYREYRAVSETILAGIPMQFDTLGKEQHFQSAGMFEMNAEYDNKPAFINSSKTIEVKLATLDTSGGKFNQYYLSNTKEKWHFVKKDSVINLKILKEDSDKLSVNKIPIDVVKPVKANEELQQFLIQIPKGSFPELEVFNNVLFEVSSITKAFDKAMTQVDWNSVEIENIENATDYKISFHAPGKDYSVLAYPVFDTINYSAALKKYKQLIAEYELKIGNRQKAMEQKSKKKETQFNAYVDAMNKFRALSAKYEKIYNDSLNAVNYLQKEFQNTTEVVYRTFQVNKFGVWNSDCPQNLPQGASLFCTFKTEEGKTIIANTVFLVEKGRNAVFTYYPKRKVNLNPDMENVLIILTSDNTLVWVSGDVLGNLNAGVKKKSFTVKPVNLSNTLSHLNQIIS